LGRYLYVLASLIRTNNHVIFIKIANYRSAEGKTAVVALSSEKYGFLGLKEIKLGEEAGSNLAYTAFNINISQDDKEDLDLKLLG